MTIPIERYVGFGSLSAGAGALLGELTISGDFPDGAVGQPYSFTPVVTGGRPPYAYAVVGALPPGMRFSSTTGRLSGTPTAGGAVPGVMVGDSADAMRTLVSAALIQGGGVPAGALRNRVSGNFIQNRATGNYIAVRG